MPTSQLDGIPVFAKVSDTLYRGGQPSAAECAQLKRIGVKTVVSLRFLGTDRFKLAGTGLRYLRIRCNALHPEEEDVIAFLKVVADPQNQPVFLHCREGVDRTGMMVAAYRVVVQGWSKEAAIAEMKAMGFNTSYDGIVDYVEGMSVERMKAKLESGKPPDLETVR